MICGKLIIGKIDMEIRDSKEDLRIVCHDEI